MSHLIELNLANGQYKIKENNRIWNMQNDYCGVHLFVKFHAYIYVYITRTRTWTDQINPQKSNSVSIVPRSNKQRRTLDKNKTES